MKRFPEPSLQGADYRTAPAHAPCRTAADRHAGGDLRRRDRPAGSRLDPGGRVRLRRPVLQRAVAARPALLTRRRHALRGTYDLGGRHYRDRLDPADSAGDALRALAGHLHAMLRKALPAGSPELLVFDQGLRQRRRSQRRFFTRPAPPSPNIPASGPAPQRSAGARACMPSWSKARRRPFSSATGSIGASTASARPGAAMPPAPFRRRPALLRDVRLRRGRENPEIPHRKAPAHRPAARRRPLARCLARGPAHPRNTRSIPSRRPAASPTRMRRCRGRPAPDRPSSIHPTPDSSRHAPPDHRPRHQVRPLRDIRHRRRADPRGRRCHPPPVRPALGQRRLHRQTRRRACRVRLGAGLRHPPSEATASAAIARREEVWDRLFAGVSPPTSAP